MSKGGRDGLREAYARWPALAHPFMPLPVSELL